MAGRAKSEVRPKALSGQGPRGMENVQRMQALAESIPSKQIQGDFGINFKIGKD